MIYADSKYLKRYWKQRPVRTRLVAILITITFPIVGLIAILFAYRKEIIRALVEIFAVWLDTAKIGVFPWQDGGTK